MDGGGVGNLVDFLRSQHPQQAPSTAIFRNTQQLIGSNGHQQQAPMGTMLMSSEADDSSTGDDLDANDLQQQRS